MNPSCHGSDSFLISNYGNKPSQCCVPSSGQTETEGFNTEPIKRHSADLWYLLIENKYPNPPSYRALFLLLLLLNSGSSELPSKPSITPRSHRNSHCCSTTPALQCSQGPRVFDSSRYYSSSIPPLLLPLLLLLLFLTLTLPALPLSLSASPRLPRTAVEEGNRCTEEDEKQEEKKRKDLVAMPSTSAAVEGGGNQQTGSTHTHSNSAWTPGSSVPDCEYFFLSSFFFLFHISFFPPHYHVPNCNFILPVSTDGITVSPHHLKFTMETGDAACTCTRLIFQRKMKHELTRVRA